MCFSHSKAPDIFFFLHGMLLCAHSVFSLSELDNHSSYLWIVDFTFWLPNCNCWSCYPTLGPRADSLWWRLQACEEDLHRRWQKCNFSLPQFVWFAPAMLYQGLPCDQRPVNCLLPQIGNVFKMYPGPRRAVLSCPTASKVPVTGVLCVVGLLVWNLKLWDQKGYFLWLTSYGD